MNRRWYETVPAAYDAGMRVCGYTTINLCARAGDKNATTLQVLVDGEPKDLTGAVVTAQARHTATDAAPALTATVTATEEALGIYTVAWDGDAVRALLNGSASWSGVWDLNVVQFGETLATTPCGGRLDALLDVTRD